METTEYKSVEKYKININPFRRQLLSLLTSILVSFMLGLGFGTPTVAVPQLRRQANSTAAVSGEMASWITSITSYTGIFWAIVLNIAAYKFGRKKTMSFTTLSTLATYLLVYNSKNVIHLFISQLMHGLTHGAHTTICMLFDTEYSSPKYRGVFLSFKAATFYSGIWVANALGTFFHYSNIGLVGITCSVYCLITLIFLPESPYWLACQEKYHECAVAHRWLKGTDEESEKELDTLIKSRKEENQDKTQRLSLIEYFIYYGKVVRDPRIYKPIFLCLLMTALFNFSGKFVCAVYAVEIMSNITKGTPAAYTAVLILDAFTVVGTYIGCYLSKLLKRRTLLLGTSIVCVVFLFLLSLYLFLVKLNVILENNYISIILLTAYSLAASCGPLFLPVVLFAELYPVKHRSFTVCIICISAKLFVGTILKISPNIFRAFDVYGSFLFFGVASSFCIMLVFKYIPETKNRTLQEIADSFCSVKSKATAESLLPERT